MKNTYSPADYPFKIVPFFSDYGFKVVFADDSLFARRAIEILAELPAPIQRLQALRNEFGGFTMEARSGVYDVIYKDEHLRVYILEMQRILVKHLAPRLMFYDFHMFNSQVRKGNQGFHNLSPVLCICILEDRMYEDTADAGKFNWHFLFRDITGKVLSENAQVRLIELVKFGILRENFHEVKTEAEKLFYTMKYAHEIDPALPHELPGFWQEDWIAEAVNKLDLARMSSLERAVLDISIVKAREAAREHKEEMQEAFEKGEKEGEKRGEKIGEKRGEKIGEKIGEKKGEDKTFQVISLYLQGKSAEETAYLTNLPLKEVEMLIARFRAIQ